MENKSWRCSSRRWRSFRRDLFVNVDCALQNDRNSVKERPAQYTHKHVHFLCNLRTLTFLFILCIDGLLLLLHELRLYVNPDKGAPPDQSSVPKCRLMVEVAHLLDSKFLICFNFNFPSFLKGLLLNESNLLHKGDNMGEQSLIGEMRDDHTILFISLRTSSSFIGLEAMIMEGVTKKDSESTYIRST